MDTEIQGPKFRLGSLDGCEIQDAVLRNASFEGVAMYDADFKNSDLSGSEFYLVPATGASFHGATLRNVKFLGGSYRDVDFTNADLSGAIFGEDNMGGAVDLCGADFSNARVDEASFESVIYDSETKFPPGFLVKTEAEKGSEAARK
jgi:uncharacterized protein YjbI with pentapeptide repeats